MGRRVKALSSDKYAYDQPADYQTFRLVFGVDTLKDEDGAVGWVFGCDWVIEDQNMLFFVMKQG